MSSPDPFPRGDAEVRETRFRVAPEWVKRVFFALLCGLAGAVLYLPSLAGQFVWDDSVLIVENQANLDEWGDALATFRRPALERERVVYYRPILIASYVLDQQRGGEPFQFHQTNLVLHGMNVAVVWGALFVFFQSAAAATMGALLFAAHPLHGQAVSLLLGRNDLLCLVPFVAALLAYREWDREDQRRRFWPAAAVVLSYAVLLWTKETGVMLPAVFVAYDLTVGRRTLRQLTGPLLLGRSTLHGSLLAITGLYFWVRWQIFGFALGGEVAGDGSFPQRLLDSVAAFGYYLQKTLLPFGLAATPHHPSLSDPRSSDFLRAALLCLGFLAATFWARRTRPWVAFGLACFGIGLVPVLGWVPVALEILEHRAYVPLLGVVITIAALLSEVGSGRRRLWAVGSLVAATGCLALLTWQRLPVFHDELSLWEASVAVQPASVYARGEYGQALAQSGKTEEAITQLREALRLAPGDRFPWFNLASSMESLAQKTAAAAERAEARGAHQEALRLEGESRRHRAEAIRRMEAYVRRWPGDTRGHFALGSMWVRSGELERAQTVFEQGQGRRPEDPPILRQLGAVREMRGLHLEAERAYEKLTDLQPTVGEHWESRGRSLYNARRYGEALPLLERAIALGHETGRTHFTLGFALFKLGRAEEAAAHAQRALELGFADERLVNKLRGVGAIGGAPLQPPRSGDE